MGHPSAPIVRFILKPNCSAVLMTWHGAHRHLMLLSVSVPPCSRGTMWSGVTAAVILPLALQSLHRGSAARRLSLSATPARPRTRSVLGCCPWPRTEHLLDQGICITIKREAWAITCLVYLKRSINRALGYVPTAALAGDSLDVLGFVYVPAHAGYREWGKDHAGASTASTWPAKARA